MWGALGTARALRAPASERRPEEGPHSPAGLCQPGLQAGGAGGRVSARRLAVLTFPFCFALCEHTHSSGSPWQRVRPLRERQ